MKKRGLLALILALMMCITILTACNSGVVTPDKPTDSSPDAPLGEPAGIAKPVTVGILGPLTGGVAEYGIAVRDGAMLFIEQYNTKGGLPGGRMIVPIQYDEEGDGPKALTGYNYLMDQGVSAIIGSVTSGPTITVVPESFNDKMPMITASATAGGVTYNADDDIVFTNMFRSCFIDEFQGEKMADFATGELGAKTAAVIFNTGVDYSIGLKDAFLAKAAKIGLEVVANEGYADGAVDFQGQLTSIAAKNPDVLFCPDYYNTIALISQQARNAGVTAALLGADGWDTVVDVMSDRSPVEGSYYCSGYSVEDTTPMVQEFLKAFTDKYGHEPNMFSAQGYDAAMILIAAMEKSYKDDIDVTSEQYRLAVIEAMRNTDMECVTGHVTYDELNNPIKSAVIITITDGVARFWGKY